MANEMRLIDATFAQHIANVELIPDNAGIVQWVLSHTPTVDAKPVVHGRWHKPTPCSGEFCTNCLLTPKTNFGWLPPYCPNCGAQMDLK